MIPRLLLELSDLKLAIGSDPYLDGEHKTSWQKHNHDKTLLYIKDFLKNCDNNLDFFKYFEFSKSENATFVPQNIYFEESKNKNYKFEKIGVHDIMNIGNEFDLLYCKAIEHISNWDKAFSAISKVSKKVRISI